MTASSEVSVSISGDLLSRLRVRAAELEVPVKWLVVGLVCDTVEHMAHECVARRVADSSLTRPRRTEPDVSRCA
jgi:hypothetical protein